MPSHLESLVAAAVRAPSGDNTQPWRFLLDEEDRRIDVFVDETRDRSPMNCGQRMARIAVGATLENILRTVRNNGWIAELQPGESSALASIRISGAGSNTIMPDKAVQERVTNRRLYDRRPVPEETLERLKKATPEFDGVHTHWISDRSRLPELAKLIGQADAMMFGESSMRQAFLANVRFDAPADAAVDEGLSLGSLELSWFERRALPVMNWMPGWLLRSIGGLRAFEVKARSLVISASGICLVMAERQSEYDDLNVGRAMERAWLALTTEKLSAQPMMSLSVLESAMELGAPELISNLAINNANCLRRNRRLLCPEGGQARLGFLLRFGHAPAPSGRTGRLPYSKIAYHKSRISPPRAVADESFQLKA